MHSHLVTVKVRIEGGANKRVQLDRFTFDQDRLKRLNTQAVQCRRAVQHDRVFADHFVQDIPYFGTLFFHQLFRLFDGAGQTLGLKPRVDERFEQLQCHLLGQTTLMQLQLWTRHNDGPA